MTTRRALVVGGSALMAGGEHDLIRSLEHLPATGWEARAALVVPEPGDIAAALHGIGVDVEVLEVQRVRNVGAGMGAVRALAGLARAADVVYASDIRAALYSQAAATVARRPWTFHARDLYAGTSTFERALRLLRPTRVVAMSEAIKERAVEITRWAPERIDVVYSGLDADAFARNADGERWREEMGLRGDEVAVGIVGRLVDWKGQDDVVRAAAIAAPQHPDARFFVVGGELVDGATRWGLGGEAARLQALADSLGVGDRVRFTGPTTDVASAMAGLDVVVVASWAEPFGLVVLEAMASGAAVVATAAGGVPEIVVDGASGLLVPPRCPPALAEAVVSLLEDPDRRRRIADAGRSRVATAFPPESGALGLAASWDRAVDGG